MVSSASEPQRAPSQGASSQRAPSERAFDLEPTDNARLANLCGPLEENLRLLESRLDVQIRRRGDSFRVIGEQAESAEDALRELRDKAYIDFRVDPLSRLTEWRLTPSGRALAQPL